MRKNIMQIGNSNGIIIPKAFIEQLGSPTSVDITLTDNKLLISPVPRKDEQLTTPITRKVIRTKTRDEDEVIGLMNLASAKVRQNIESGKVRWTDQRVMIRKIDL